MNKLSAPKQSTEREERKELIEVVSLTPWFVYILCCADDTLYTGVATDLERRLHEHNHTSRGARYTRIRRPVRLVYFESVADRSLACRRERVIKKYTRQEKQQLIANNPLVLS